MEDVLGRRRRLPDDARGHLDVLLAQRPNDVSGRQVEPGQLAGIEPYAHAEFAQAELGDTAHAVHPGEDIAQLNQAVVANVRLIIAVYELRQEESMNVETVEGKYVPGSDEYLR